MNIVFWFFLIFNIQKSFYRRSETSIHSIVSMGVNLLCQICFGIMYYRDISKFQISNSIIGLTVFSLITQFILLVVCLYRRQDYKVKSIEDLLIEDLNNSQEVMDDNN